MRHENSYKENMKKSAVEQQRKEDAFMLQIFSQMVIDESVLKARRKQLMKAIDDALDHRHEEQFYKLSEQYKELLKHYK